ncbi:substrate-binding domain-containing protein [Leptolyngbya sp. PCC 6406]|uniref:substrate-binding domain-containing protein n=1 Tax=Leptolyngbya sp. PCC 6406 TaxID=1173264 RepID=UPI0002AC4233|nr:substrate-binding domain-containing protein [Leptolyngbya sp. PCC 6406]
MARNCDRALAPRVDAMKNIPQILLKRYLRSQPTRIRLSQFNFLSRYAWLSDLLKEIQPELFPPEPKAEEVVASPEAELPDESVLQIIDAHIRGQRGTYHVERWIGQRGTGHLFAGMQVGANQPVVVKEFLLPPRFFNDEEATERQQAFTSLAGVKLADGRVQDSRVLAPLEAIADTHTFQRCYLVTDSRDASPTLRQHLSAAGPFSPLQVREVLDQVLQTLIFLHQQRFVLPAGQLQTGLVHGNLSLDSLLWVEQPEKFFIYLCDLALWERLFDPPMVKTITHTVAQDLMDLGQVAFALLVGNEPSKQDFTQAQNWPEVDADLRYFIQRLLALAPPFETAAAAREALRALPRPLVVSDTAEPVELAQRRRRRIPWRNLGLGLVGLLLVGAVGWWLWQRWSSRQALAQPRLCCLKDVSAVPEEPFLYTAVEGSTWSQIARQGPTTLGLPSLQEQLAAAQPSFQPVFRPAESLEAAIAAVESQEAAFAVIPLVGDLPYTVATQIIAYDALAVVVPYSYAQRQRGLPRTLGGQLSLEQVRRLYAGEFFTWRSLGGADMPVRLYAPENAESLALFGALLYGQAGLQPQPPTQQVTLLPPLEMLRTLIRDFETEGVGSIAFAPLSQISGQCSIYPLALADQGRGATQPLTLTTGDSITPQIDLCNRKGQYFPDLDALKTGAYPLSYPIAVIYPLDNRRPPFGQKFAELMLTDEGQQFLWQKGFVPVHQEAGRVNPRRISEQNVAN